MLRSRECYYDLHIHTRLHSQCSELSPEEAVSEAQRRGLDGIAFAEHSYTWTSQEIEELKDRMGCPSFPILAGREVSTRSDGRETGDLLVFGATEIPEGAACTIDEVCRIVRQQSGIVIAAHPYAELLGIGDEVRSARIDAIEVANHRHRNMANTRRLQGVCRELNVPAVASSDAHSRDEIGRYCVRFGEVVRTEADLVRVIRGGGCEPCLGLPPGRIGRVIRGLL